MQCVFYAPLTEKGDITDYISVSIGIQKSLAGAAMPSDNLTYSTANGCYMLHAQYGCQNAVSFPMTDLRDRLQGNDITQVVTVKLGNLNKFVYALGIGYANNGDAYGYSLTMNKKSGNSHFLFYLTHSNIVRIVSSGNGLINLS